MKISSRSSVRRENAFRLKLAATRGLYVSEIVGSSSMGECTLRRCGVSTYAHIPHGKVLNARSRGYVWFSVSLKRLFAPLVQLLSFEMSII